MRSTVSSVEIIKLPGITAELNSQKTKTCLNGSSLIVLRVLANVTIYLMYNSPWLSHNASTYPSKSHR